MKLQAFGMPVHSLVASRNYELTEEFMKESRDKILQLQMQNLLTIKSKVQTDFPESLEPYIAEHVS